ncbi:MAG: hypothetical protein IT430_03960 [Phycisphaerales bacterium]|nr:hypothetical protein [Phycisphaerales bacterium]
MSTALRRVPMREQTAADQRAAVLATGDAGSVPREIIRLECPTCETVIGPAAVVEYARNEVSFGLAAYMATYCPHCKHAITFVLQVDRSSGKRDTRPLRKRIHRGEHVINRLLSEYPQIRGVLQ